MIGVQQQLFDSTAQFADRATSDVTFKGKMSLPIHRWYRLTASFSPRLADDIADYFRLGPDDLVLDPFSGVGTVPLCMRQRGVRACSVEFNPFLHFVSTVKCRGRPDVAQVRRFFDNFLDRLAADMRTLPRRDDLLAQWLVEHAQWVPPIHRPERWWSPGNLAQLVLIRRLVLALEETGEHVDLLQLGVLGILVPASNAKHNHVSLTFADEPQPTLDIVAMLRDKLAQIASDLEHAPAATATVYHGNSKRLTDALPGDVRPSVVITSPPYPNRFSYARETRPHMFFFDFIPDATAVGELETDAIGGTWGRATSVLAKGVEPANDAVASLLEPYLSAIDGGGELMAAYVTKYFNDMHVHAAQVAQVCRPRAKLAYVIGNSKFYGQPLPSDELLAGLFEDHGFRLDSIEKMRRRQSKTGLYEAVVFLSRDEDR